jgi:hypothetical protein
MRIKAFLALVLFAATAVATRADTVFPTNLLVTGTGFCIPDDPYGPGLGCSPVDVNLNIAVRPALEAPPGYVEVVDVTGTLNHSFPITNGAGGFLLADQGYIPGFGGISSQAITFDAMGTNWYIYREIMSGVPAVYGGNGSASWLGWGVTEVFAAPEPSALVLLCAGLTVILLGMSRFSHVRPLLHRP